jgi:hypothetical protein
LSRTFVEASAVALHEGHHLGERRQVTPRRRAREARQPLDQILHRLRRGGGQLELVGEQQLLAAGPGDLRQGLQRDPELLGQGREALRPIHRCHETREQFNAFGTRASAVPSQRQRREALLAQHQPGDQLGLEGDRLGEPLHQPRGHVRPPRLEHLGPRPRQLDAIRPGLIHQAVVDGPEEAHRLVLRAQPLHVARELPLHPRAPAPLLQIAVDGRAGAGQGLPEARILGDLSEGGLSGLVLLCEGSLELLARLLERGSPPVPLGEERRILHLLERHRAPGLERCQHRARGVVDSRRALPQRSQLLLRLMAAPGQLSGTSAAEPLQQLPREAGRPKDEVRKEGPTHSRALRG